MWIRGVKPDGAFVEEFRWSRPVPVASAAEDLTWDGSYWRAEAEKKDCDLEWNADLSGRCVFVSHARAVRGEKAKSLSDARVWTSGTASWFKLSAQGVWVEGCAELLGFEKLRPVLGEAVLQLAPFSRWTVLTHEAARSDWSDATAIATYRVSAEYSQAAKDALKRAKYVFWSSGSQFDELSPYVAPGADQACGLGKTADRLSAQDATKNLRIFPSVEEWRKWIPNKANSR
jgi:hypothetical protein